MTATATSTPAHAEEPRVGLPENIMGGQAEAASGGARATATAMAAEAQAQPAGGEPVAQAKPADPHHGWAAAVQSLISTVVIAVFVITFIVQAFIIPSESMEKTLLVGDYLLVDKVHYASGGIWGHVLPYTKIRRGDIVVFRYPVDPTQYFVKRVVGVPGDHIRMRDKRVFVNGKLVDEPYVQYLSPAPDIYRDDFPALGYPSPNMEAKWWEELPGLVHGGELVVPPERYFVMGDNRDESLDSRYWGFVPRANVIGRPLLIYWSFGPRDEVPDPPGADGTLKRLESVFTRLYEDTRWTRMMRLVR